MLFIRITYISARSTEGRKKAGTSPAYDFVVTGNYSCSLPTNSTIAIGALSPGR